MNSKKRAFLKKKAHNLEAIVRIGIGLVALLELEKMV